jgi:hypothetical protein
MYSPKHMEDREWKPKAALIVTTGNGELVSTMTGQRLDRLSLLVVGQRRGNGSTAVITTIMAERVCTEEQRIVTETIWAS